MLGLGYGVLFWMAVGLLAFIVSWVVNRRQAAQLRQRREAGLTSDASRLKSRMKRLARPTLLLVPARQPGFSKLGGAPDLPSELDWPIVRGRPTAFLAQVDLTHIQLHAPLEWLPGEGRIFVFVDLEGPGFPDHVVVRFSLEPDVGPRMAPEAVSVFPERRVAFERYVSAPSLDWLGEDVRDLDVDPDELDELANLPDEPFGDEIQHRIGGYPSEIQEEQMAVACELMRRGLPSAYEGAELTPAILRASKAWRLLLQVDSDPALKMNWGDGGRLYVFIREQDAKARDFSRTITLSQSC